MKKEIYECKNVEELKSLFTEAKDEYDLTYKKPESGVKINHISQLIKDFMLSYESDNFKETEKLGREIEKLYSKKYPIITSERFWLMIKKLSIGFKDEDLKEMLKAMGLLTHWGLDVMYFAKYMEANKSKVR